MSKLPYMQFYPSDWLTDPALRTVPLAAKGLWIDMLCLMWMSPDRGVLRTRSRVNLDAKSAASLLNIDVRSFRHLVDILERSGAISRTDDGDICSRRMLRDEEIRKTKAAAGAKGGAVFAQAKHRAKREQNPEVLQNHISEVRHVLEQNPQARDGAEVQKAPATQAGAAMEFPVNGGAKVWHLPRSKLSEWADAFPGLNVEAECKRARQWCIDNPKRRKTANGMLAFLFTWLSKEQNRGTGNRSGAGPDRQSPARYEGTFESDFAEVRRRNEALQESSGGADGSGPYADQAGVPEGGDEVPF